MIKVTLIVVVTLLTAGALYVAISGWRRAELDIPVEKNAKERASNSEPHLKFRDHGVLLDGVEELKRHLNEQAAEQTFSLTFNLPRSLHLLLAGMSFGFLGAVLRLLLVAVGAKNADLDSIKTFFILALGTLTGLVVILISTTFPSTFSINERPINVSCAFLFFSLLSGLFSKHFYRWLEVEYKKRLKEPEEF